MKTIEITGSDLDAIVRVAMKRKFSKEEEQKQDIFLKIIIARQKKGWTHAELSEKSGVKEKTIMEMETMIAKPQFIDVIKVCNALDLDVTAN